MNKFVVLLLTLLLSGLTLFLLVFLMNVTHSALLMEWEILSLGLKSIMFTVFLDKTSMVFLMTVFWISFSVFNFSMFYMKSESNFNRFHMLLILFVISMIFLLLSPNLVSLIIGWDGLGLTSYLLVVYYNSKKSYNSGMITFLSNRVGDSLVLISMGMLLTLNSFNFYEFMWLTGVYYSSIWFLVISAFTKSAQIPFSAWLPAAMAAPTPVSALVHSSTLVTAGVYILIRVSPLLKETEKQFLFIIGTLTMTLASFSALKEMDSKKMVALSTLSQLGVMIISLGVGLQDIAFFHLIVHAFFKALLFISMGSMIHSSESYQDLRKMGNKINFLPFTSSIMLICSFSLCGLPFMSAFYSKEMIMELMIIMSGSSGGYMIFVLGLGLTLAYSLRLIFISSSSYSNQGSMVSVGENNYFLLFSMIILILPAIITGSCMGWFMKLSFNLIWFNESLKFLGMLFMLFILLSLILAGFKPLSFLSDTIFNMWSLPSISTQWVLMQFSDLGLKLRRFSDLYWVFTGQTKIIKEIFLLSSSEYWTKHFFAFNRLMILSMVMLSLFFLV